VRCEAAKDFIARLGPEAQVIRSRSDAETVYLRLPVMMDSQEAKAQLCELSDQKGLGISPLYPTAIHAIEQLRPRLGKAEFPGATAVAERLVTLPVHHLAQPEDRRTICTIIYSMHKSRPGGDPRAVSHVYRGLPL
jgi:perosamine synthetase